MSKVYAFGYEPEEHTETKPCTLCEEEIYKDGAGYVVNEDGTRHTCFESEPKPKESVAPEDVAKVEDECPEDKSDEDESETDDEYDKFEDADWDDELESQEDESEPETETTLADVYTEDELIFIVRMLEGFYDGIESGNIVTSSTSLKGIVQSAEGKMALGLIFNPKPTHD